MAAPSPTFNPAAEANALADRFYAASAALDSLRLNFNPPLPLPEQQRLRDESNALTTRAQYLTAQAIGVTLAAIQGSLGGIKASTDTAIAQLRHLQDLDRAIVLATSLVKLGAALSAGDPGTIASAAQGLVRVLR